MWNRRNILFLMQIKDGTPGMTYSGAEREKKGEPCETEYYQD